MRCLVPCWRRAAICGPGLALLVFCSSVPPPRQDFPPGDFRAFEAVFGPYLQARLDASDATGLSLVVADSESILFARGVGFADREREIPATPQTLYEAGSISKLFTAGAIVQLADEERLRLDQPLAAQLPGFHIGPPPCSLYPQGNCQAAITPRNILTHHSGLPTDLFVRAFAAGEVEPLQTRELLARLRNEYAAYPPGYAFAYSNIGPTLLGLLIEEVSGQDFEAYMQRRVFEPAGMHTATFLWDESLRDSHAVGYRGGRALPVHRTGMLGAGSLRASPTDLARFGQVVLRDGRGARSQRVYTPQQTRRLLAVQNADNPRDFDRRIGLGWMEVQPAGLAPEGRIVGHGGGTVAFHSSLLVLPERNLVVVAMGNDAESAALVQEVAREAARYAAQIRAGRENPKPPGSQNEATPEAAFILQDEVDPQTLAADSGTYQSFFGLLNLKHDRDDGRLRGAAAGLELELHPARPRRQQPSPKVAVAQNLQGYRLRMPLLFGLFAIDLPLFGRDGLAYFPEVEGRRFLAIGDARAETLRLNAIGARIDLYPITPAWRERIGLYELVHPEDAWTQIEGLRVALRESEERLLLDLMLPGAPRLRYALAPLTDQRAVIQGIGRGLGESVRFVCESGAAGCDADEGRLFFRGLELRRAGE